VLGQDHKTYDAYRRKLRKEFRFLEELAWQMGRTIFLATLCLKHPLYSDGAFEDRLGDRARENMARELQELSPCLTAYFSEGGSRNAAVRASPTA